MRLGKELAKGVIEEPAELSDEVEVAGAEHPRPARPATTARQPARQASEDRSTASR